MASRHTIEKCDVFFLITQEQRKCQRFFRHIFFSHHIGIIFWYDDAFSLKLHFDSIFGPIFFSSHFMMHAGKVLWFEKEKNEKSKGIKNFVFKKRLHKVKGLCCINMVMDSLSFVTKTLKLFSVCDFSYGCQKIFVRLLIMKICAKHTVGITSGFFFWWIFP